MGYNRALDLMAIATAAVKAGLPAKAATYLQAAAKDGSSDAAIQAVFAANAKKKTPAKKKKAKASFTNEQLAIRAAFRTVAGDDDMPEADEEMEEAEEPEEDVVEAESDEDMMMVTEDDSVAALRAALESVEPMIREEEAEGVDNEEKPLDPNTLATARRAKASRVDSDRFARTLRNLAARSK